MFWCGRVDRRCCGALKGNPDQGLQMSTKKASRDTSVKGEISDEMGRRPDPGIHGDQDVVINFRQTGLVNPAG